MSSDCACPRFTPRVRATRVCVSVSWCAVHFVTRLTPGSELCLSQIAVNSGRQEMCLSAMFPRSLCLSSKPRPRSLVRLCLSAVRIATPSPRAHSALLTTGKSALWGSVFAVWGNRSKVIAACKQLFCRRAAHAERVVVAAMCCDRPQRETLRRSQRTRAGM